MENKQRIRPLTPTERKFIEEKHHLIIDFLKRQRLDIEEFYDVVVFDYILSVEKYLSNTDLQEKCQFEAVAYMYMKRAVYRYFREQKAQKRSSEAGADISLETITDSSSKPDIRDATSTIEYMETLKEIKSNLTDEQQKIFSDKLTGYSLKEIADNNGISQRRVYRQFAKVKNVVINVMEI